MERLRSENEAFRQSAGTQAVIERNAKIQDLEQRNQELRVQLTEVRKKLVDIEAGKEDIQRSLDQARVKLRNLEEIDSPLLETRQDVNRYLDEGKVISKQRSDYACDALDKIRDREKAEKAIALSTTTPPQVEASEPGEVTDKPPCPSCGEAVRIRNNGIRKNRDGIPISQRWRCNSCTKSWSVAIALLAND